MTNVRTLLLLCLLPFGALAANDDAISLKSQIESVTVFQRGAQVTRTARTTLQPGTNVVRFEDLSPGINPNSIQVSGNQKFTILSVNHRINFLEEIDNTSEIQQLQKQLEDLEFEARKQGSLRSVHEREREMILNNKKISGETQSLNIEDLMELADFYRNRLREIEYKLLEISRETTRLDKDMQKVKKQLHNLNSNRQKNKSEITISLRCDSRTSTDIELSFMIYQAGWTPLYDVRSKDASSPVTVTYKSKVWQNSGYDWDKVNLRLSTGDPTKSNTQPTVNPWVLEFETLQLYGNLAYRDNNVRQNSAYSFADSTTSYSNGRYDLDDRVITGGVPGSYAFGDMPVNDPTSAAFYTTASAGSVTVEFDIDIKYSIPTDGKHYDVEIQQFNTPVNYAWFAAPKLDQDAFLIAKIHGWDQYNMLCLLYTSPSPRDGATSRMPSSA